MGGSCLSTGLTLRQAHPGDLPALRTLDIRYAYRDTLEDELNSSHADDFHWFIALDGRGEIQAYHRSILASGVALLSGVYAQSNSQHGWLLFQIAHAAVRDLSSKSAVRELRAWTNDALSPKAEFLRRFGFSEEPSFAYRLVFKNDALKRLQRAADDQDSWRDASVADEQTLQKFVHDRHSTRGNVGTPLLGGLCRWLIAGDGDSIHTAIAWFKIGSHVEIPFIHSHIESAELFGGIAALGKCSSNATSLRVTLPEWWSLTLIRLLSIRPQVYAPTAKVVEFRLNSEDSTAL